MNGTQQGIEDYSQLDPQGIFGSILGGAAGRLIGGLIGGKTGRNVGGIVGKVGGGFLPFSAGPDTAQPTDMELQSFWSVLKKIGQGVQTGLNVGQTARRLRCRSARLPACRGSAADGHGTAELLERAEEDWPGCADRRECRSSARRLRCRSARLPACRGSAAVGHGAAELLERAEEDWPGCSDRRECRSPARRLRRRSARLPACRGSAADRTWSCRASGAC